MPSGKVTTGSGHPCDFCEREFGTAMGANLHMRDWCPQNPDAVRPDGLGRPKKTESEFPQGVSDDSPFSEAPPVEVVDAAPPEPSWRERLWGVPAEKTKQSGERRPRKRRVSTEGVWSTLWTAAGAALCSTGADIPVGNCLQFQAPIVGGILDEVIAGTFVDTLIQPIAGQGKRLKAVSSVLAMPILVGALERNPGAAPILEPLLRQVIREHLVAMTPVIKARQKADESYRKALGELGMEAGEDPVEAVLDAIFPKDGTPSGNGVGRATVDA